MFYLYQDNDLDIAHVYHPYYHDEESMSREPEMDLCGTRSERMIQEFDNLAEVDQQYNVCENCKAVIIMVELAR